ncbi:MAG: DVUA0089 family protein [Phycisphaerae bacterium]|jgi:hypothetical protein|nr:DVUA0089 family protein [Phycisphaerae bacterium]
MALIIANGVERPRTLRSVSTLAVALLATTAAFAGPTFEEVPDAGATPATAQPTTGSGPLGRIKGALAGTADAFDFEDVYLICINDPASFSATVNATMTDFDTELWLFKIDGTGLLSNDNDPLSFPTIFSRIGNAATDGSGAAVTAPGLYFLAITAKNNVPLAFGQPLFNDPTFNRVEVSGPDGPGGPFPWQNWTGTPVVESGAYAIDLTGVKFFAPPCELACPAEATFDWDAFLCEPFDANVNGGCTEPGNPLQPIGALAWGTYRAVCGTIGVETNAGIPIHNESDWFLINIAQPGYLTISLVAMTPEFVPVTNARVGVREGVPCDSQVVLGQASGLACPLTLSHVPVNDGPHVVALSLEGVLPDGPECPVQYVLWIDLRPPLFDACGFSGAGACDEAHPDVGCNDVDCCDTVCAVDPFCCESTWDSLCATEAIDHCRLVAPPSNDECGTAQRIGLGDTSFSTVGATTSDVPLPPACDKGFGLEIVNDIWYRFEASADGVAMLTTCGQATFDTRMAVYTDCPDAGGVLLACNDDFPGCGVTSQLALTTVCGENYIVRVGGFAGSGSGILTLTQFGRCGPSCMADLNGDNLVGGGDLAILLGAWGNVGPHPANLNGDRQVDAADLAILLGAWGPCPR